MTRAIEVSRKTRLVGLGTALPPHKSAQGDIAWFLSRVVEAQPDVSPRFGRYIDALSRRSGIATRYSVLSDYTQRDPDGFTFYPPNWRLEPFPTTEDRMQVYRQASVTLAETAAREALREAEIEPQAVTHVVITTCTGFFAPGPDVALAGRLGLNPSVKRTQIGFMGCYAGINGIRLADEIVRSEPGAVVLQIAVELCSLHYQRAPRLDYLVPNLLFADGAAAAVYRATPETSSMGAGLATVMGTRSRLVLGTERQMSWDIGNHGFIMTLDDAVPQTLAEHAGEFVSDLARSAGMAQSSSASWAVHPGGKRVVEAVARALSIDDAAMSPSFDVLRKVGNLSSATVFFVLKEVLRRGARGPIFTLGFGPGLTMEGALLVAE